MEVVDMWKLNKTLELFREWLIDRKQFVIDSESIVRTKIKNVEQNEARRNPSEVVMNTRGISN